MEVIELPDGHTQVTFVWAPQENDCYDCGLPAPFESVDAYGPGRHKSLCAVCAAQAACDGETIRRVSEEPR